MINIRHTRLIVFILALIIGATGKALAVDLAIGDIVIEGGTPEGVTPNKYNVTNGAITVKSVASRTVTITVEPASGYILLRSNIVVQKLVDPGRALAPRRTPRITPSLTVSGPVRCNSATDYTFVVPADYDGALVSVTFTSTGAASADIIANSLAYTGEAQPLVTQGAVEGCSYDSGTVLAAGTLLKGYFTKSGDEYSPCIATATADGTTRYYRPDVTYSLTVDGTYTSTIPTRTVAGDYTVYYKVAPDGYHTEGSGSVNVTIQRATLTEVTLVQSVQNYSGSAVAFVISTVKAGTLTASTLDVDYEVDAVNGDALTQTAVGTYTLMVKGKGNFGGTVTTSFRIVDGSTHKIIYSNTPASEITNSAGTYILADDVNYSKFANLTAGTFTGTLDGNFHTISGLSAPLFNTVNGGTVKNVMLEGVAISSDAAAVGAIAGTAQGYSLIYNCGILPDDATFPEGTHPTVTTTGACAGGIVGSLQGDSRVINCFSYADVSAATTAAGIVGENTYASTAVVTDDKYADLRTAIVNCMFYGNITGGTNQYGVYGGTLITNAASTGISSYNYYRNGSTFSTASGEPTAYNCSFPAEERYLTQVEFHRSLLNSNRELCGWWVGAPSAPSAMTTAEVQAVPKDASLMAKWVVDPNIAPYPILKPFGKYPSIVNGNTGNPWFNRSMANPYEGKQLGTLTVTVKPGEHHTASDQTLTLPITDMDTLHSDYGYYKVQLPYYNTVFGNPRGATWAEKYADNYTDYVVTGWKVTAVTINGTVESYNTFVADWQDGYNFADRKCTDKDKFDVSGRVFAQGGNYYVPDGVIGITIEAYWGKAIYVRNNESSYDRVNITLGNTGSAFAPAGTRGNNVNGATIQTTTNLSNALTDANINAKKTVYDYALVLVGNVQESVGDNPFKHATSDRRGFTIMSVDLDFDEEPDYCLEWQLGAEMKRQIIAPIRFDFLPVVELGIAGKLDGSTNFFSLGCYRSRGHFEVTETSFIRFGQFEFELKDRDEGPIILNGGIYDQYCRGRNNETDQHINYVILGGHIVMPSFTPGAHVAASYKTRHCAVNALGGAFTSFYLTGGYREDIDPNDDNPHCYIDGGHFGTIAAAYKEGIKGNVTWRINHALIDEFYGGGVMSDDNKIVKGSIDVVIDNSIVGKYCGGPKFGDMVSDKTVTTSATNTVFNKYFGAGNGGTAYIQYANTDKSDSGPLSESDWATIVSSNYHVGKYRSMAQGYEADYDIEVINPSTGDLDGKVVNRSYYYAAQFATTNTGSVTNTLKGCTVKTNFYGGGFLGGVTGNVTSTLTNCTVNGNAFGAGYSASAGTVTISNRDKTPPSANIYTSMITPESGGTSNTYYWTNDYGTTGSPITAASPATGGRAYFYTEVPLTNLGAVSGDVTLTLSGTTVGTEDAGNRNMPVAETGFVFGGGDESNVEGNTTVTMTSGYVMERLYGGGNHGNVGTITSTVPHTGAAAHDGCIGKPDVFADNTGKCTVNISGGQVGPKNMVMPDDYGYVFGAGRGVTRDPAIDKDIDFKTYVYETDVTISGTALICGGVYGGSERGRVRNDTNVKIQGGQVGIGVGKDAAYAESLFINPATATASQISTAASSMTECAHWTYDKDTGYPYDEHASDTWYNPATYGTASTTGTDGHTFYGNVFGGGSGYFPYPIGDDGAANGYDWLPSAGKVEGKSHVTISGGHILTNVYGGNELTDVADTCFVTMTGGTIGIPRTLDDIVAHPVTCYLFGAGKGDQRIHFNKSTNVGNAVVNVSGGIIYGSVFGGAEDGHVERDVKMTINGGTIGTWGTSYVDGNVFGGGRGFGGDAYTAGNVAGCVYLNITGGRMLGSIYGGGRLGSVGYGLFMVEDKDVNDVSRYGRLRPDNTDDDLSNSPKADFKRGYVTINISGGTIGNDIEYTWNPSSAFKTANMPLTTFEDGTNRLLHTKGGNVFSGGMGRREKLDGVTPIDALEWHKLGNVKGTKITISGDAWIKSNVYGGGELGAVRSYYEGELSNPTKIEGGNTEIIISGGTIGTMIGDGIIGGTKDTESTRGSGSNRYCFGNVFGGGYGTEKDIIDNPSTPDVDESIPYTKDMEKFAALVVGNSSVTMSGGTVLGSVYGGGEVACIGGSSNVEITGGVIGVNEVNPTSSDNPGYVLFGSWRMGNVYGGGRGSTSAVNAGLVRSNATVDISGTPKIYHNVYGGGALGSVGWFTFTDGLPTSCSSGTGTATVSITGGTIGISGRDNGMVNGSSRGDVAKPTGDPAVDVNDRLGWVNNTVVTVGGTAHIKGSLYGGGENGHNMGNATVTLNSGTIGIIDPTAPWFTISKDGETAAQTQARTRKANKVRGNVYGAGCGTDTYTGDDGKEHNNPLAGIVKGNTTVTINGGTVRHDVFGGGSMGPVGGSVEVTINDGLIQDDVYGGCAKTDSNINNATDYGTAEEALTSTSTYTTTVNLHGGRIEGMAFGGGLGTKQTVLDPDDDDVPAYVYGDVLVKLNEEASDDCEVLKVHGCNNYNGSPKGAVTVHVYKTVAYGDVYDEVPDVVEGTTPVTGYYTKSGDVYTEVTDEDAVAADTKYYAKTSYTKSVGKDNTTFDMIAVYGGGNEAAHEPVLATTKPHVIIDGCSDTSINYVYGGGNAAPAAGTHVEVNECYEIGSIFGGGNGFDARDDGTPNPGANVGYKDPTYSFTPDPAKTDEENEEARAEAEAAAFAAQKAGLSYGSGDVLVEAYGGTIHYVFGGSNTKGNIRNHATVKLDDAGGGCPLTLDEVYGAGKDAAQDASSEIQLGCVSYLEELYGGARNADIDNNIVLNIQSGRFHRVFGGNNIGGNISGTITVNVEETGCHPIIIGQLFGGGNMAAYTAPWKDNADHTLGRKNGPTLNVKSFTSIGEIYGGGYGEPAVVTGDTYINIDECLGKFETPTGADLTTVTTYTGDNKKTVITVGEDNEHNPITETVVQYGHANGKIGAIGNVYGGGNAADVDGNTNVKIGTLETVTFETDYVTEVVKDGEGNTVYEDDDVTPKTQIVYESDGVTPKKKTVTVKGVDIRGNVFGGGNRATVRGNTNVTVGKRNS